jgi:hypothetical protein
MMKIFPQNQTAAMNEHAGENLHSTDVTEKQ